MTTPLRRPALTPAAVRAASVHATSPAQMVGKHFEDVWQTRMRDMPFVNPALAVEPVGFQRFRGDWVGVLITPWFINLLLLRGGGELWRDIAASTRRAVEFPCGMLTFIADDDPQIGLYQYCPLLSAMQEVVEQGCARTVATDAIAAVLTQRKLVQDYPAAAPVQAVGPSEAVDNARRGFLLRAGKRN